MKNHPFLYLILCGLFLNINCSQKAKEESIKGDYFNSSGVKIYYETIGKGPNLLLLHGNSGGINSMKQQTTFFSKNYRVIVMDCRGRGKSEMGGDSLTYEAMMQDANSLLEKLKVDSAFVFGYSDGGIIGLLLAMNHPEKVKKLAIFGANLNPDTLAVFTNDVLYIAEQSRKAREMIIKKDKTKNWESIEKLYRLMQYQPNISPIDLQNIEAPVLVMSSENDVIKEEHTLIIFKNLKKAQLIIYPGETHEMVKSNPSPINASLDKFFQTPYKPDSRVVH